MRAYKLKKCKRVHGLHFTPDGARLLAVGGAEVRMVDCAVCLDLATGENVGRIEQFAHCYAVDPALTRFVLGGANNWRGGIGSVQWTAVPGAVEWQAFTAPKGDVSGLAFDASGTRMAIATMRQLPRRGGERVWQHELNVVQFDPFVHLYVGTTTESVSVLAFNAGATRLAVTGGVDGDTVVGVYDLGTRKSVLTFAPPGTVTRSAQFLPDDRVVVANGRYVYVLPADGGKPQFALAGHPKQVNAVAVTPDGRRLLTASHDGSIRTWDANTGEPGPSFDWKIGAITALAFAPDGLTCAASGLNGNVVVWDVDA